jgi:hypothetical protein
VTPRRVGCRAPAASAILLAATVASCQRDAGPRDAGLADARPGDPAELGRPDLAVVLDRARADLAIGEQDVAADACELAAEEACVGGPGLRRLLHFSVEIPNLGARDLALGAPADDDRFTYSSCHAHYHLDGFADYRLLDAAGAEVVVGRKQAYCLLDTTRVLDEPDVAQTPRYDCDFQGIQRGWADLYHSRLPCQYLDVTGVADGAYTLEVEIDPDAMLDDGDRSNNTIALPVEIGGPDLAAPTEPCPTDLDSTASASASRECGWQLAERATCAPGATVHVGCAASCGLGSCTGAPMLRVCDAARPDGNCAFPSALGVGDGGCGSSCPVVGFIVCPPGGELAIYSAATQLGVPYTCAVETTPTAGLAAAQNQRGATNMASATANQATSPSPTASR